MITIQDDFLCDHATSNRLQLQERTALDESDAQQVRWLIYGQTPQ
jgi:hypothetical protein